MQHSPMVQAILPLRCVIVTLRWLYPSSPGFYHHAGLHAWLRYLAGSPADFSEHVVIDPLENGHAHFKKDEEYRFRLVVCRGGESLLHTLLEKIRSLPDSVPQSARQAGPFGDNLAVVSLVDGFEHHAVSHVDALTQYDHHALTMETALWTTKPFFKIVFRTPARLLRPKSAEGHPLKGVQRFCRDKADMTWSLFTQRLTDTLINLCQQKTGKRAQRYAWPDATLHNALAFWVNNSYQGRHNGQIKDVSGVISQLQISLPDSFPADLLALIVLGQYVGIGQNRSFGMGQYQLQDAYGISTYSRPGATLSLLDRCFNDDALKAACAVMHPRKPSFYDHENAEEQQQAEQVLFNELLESKHKLYQGNYQASVLMPVEIDKPDGGTRKLSVPSWHDRTLQKAVTEHLGHTLDTLWIKNSFGYRKGHSRLNARDEINKYIQKGYDWVLESDIRGFFDSVEWLNLEQRLQLLYPNDPLIPILMAWVKADQGDAEQITPRHKGLPQGAPISPLLANLLLDDLDQDMLAKGHHIVRYADDFVLLFKTEAEAKAALDDIQDSLKEHHLAINLDKTRIVEAKQGFRYLGYLFIDGYAIESKREKTDSKHNSNDQITEKPSSSLPVRTSDTNGDANNSIGERDTLGSLLIIAGDIAMLSSEKHRLIVEQYDQRHSYPWRTLSSVLLIGPHHITTPALKSAMTNAVPIHFANGFGQYQGTCAGAQPSPLGVDFWIQQAQYLDNQVNALAISQALITARVQGIQSVIKRRDEKAVELDSLRPIVRKIRRVDNLDQLRGYEGQASKLLWQFFKRILEPDWQFTHRNRRPPKDPVNAMLSLGYTFLYSVVDSINRTVGLYPWQGAMHQSRGHHHTLASDLMEPMRYLVERSVLTLINRGQIKPDAFATQDTQCQMSSEARKTLLHELLVQLTQQTNNRDSLLNQLRDQSYRLVLTCKHGQPFQPWSPKK